MEAKSLVLMEKVNGILEKELGSYEIDTGIDFIFKAYVENGTIHLFLSTESDVSDDEYGEIFDMYDTEESVIGGAIIEEIDYEYNPVWLYKFPYVDEHEHTGGMINDIVKVHEEKLKKIYSEIRK